MLRQVAAGDAFHDAAERFPQPRCHPETRTKMLDDLWNWASKVDLNKRVLWLFGPAGAGKSAIAQSFCQKLETEGRLGASFFFKRGHPSRGNGNKLFMTIAYQLAYLRDLPRLKHAISQELEDDPTILDRSLLLQLQKLIITPFKESIPGRILVIVIDGLDECEGQKIQQEILQSIAQVIRHEHLPLLFFIASRPEPHISEMFCGPFLDAFHYPMNIRRSFDDVRKYLKDEFSRIHRGHPETMAIVSRPWPSTTILEHLVEKSSGYFIYASTIIKFIDDKDFRPTERLDAIMGIGSLESPDEAPFGALDQLYIHILSQTRPAICPRLRKILTVLIAELGSPLHICRIEQLLELRAGDVRLALRGLHSVLSIPHTSKDEDIYSVEYAITVHHASFRDFLEDPNRSGNFHVGDEQRTDLARYILRAFTRIHIDPLLNPKGEVAG
jgi:hypothetical protein